jgi:hypothetical protein
MHGIPNVLLNLATLPSNLGSNGQDNMILGGFLKFSNSIPL